jgi:hypothetical protein
MLIEGRRHRVERRRFSTSHLFPPDRHAQLGYPRIITPPEPESFNHIAVSRDLP